MDVKTSQSIEMGPEMKHPRGARAKLTRDIR